MTSGATAWASERPATAATNPVLFGDQTVESNQDSNGGPSAQAFSVSNSTAATAQSITVYVDGANAATTLIAGLYADNSGHPGALLASGSLSSLNAGAWNSVPIASTSVTAGTYWIAILGTGGALYFRDQISGSCTTETSAQGTLASLPSTWSTGGVWTKSYCPPSAYVRGSSGGSGGGTSAPSNTTLPQVSGTPVQGDTLTTSNGSWSGSPTGYTYALQDCNSTGLSCTNISGATLSSYKLQASDVGSTIRSVVTATNSVGSATVSSAPTGVVAAASAPTVTTVPSISGTAQQGQVLTVSNGSWSGTAPISYAYQWQQDGTTNISGATSSTYTAQASDVGHTLDVVVSATNGAGSASATSNSTAAVTASAGLPSGVSLQQIDGGMNYFSKFSNVPAAWSTSNFFPIGAWNEPFPATGDATAVAAYKNEGVNGFMALANGYTSTLLNQLSSNGMWFINYEGGLNASVPQAGPMVGHFWTDEADGNARCSDMPTAAALGETVPCTSTSDGRTPASAIAQATSDYHGAHGAGDPTRFVFGQFTKPVSMNQGLTSTQAAAYENAVDVISYDHYIINDSWNPGSLWTQYDEVQNVRAQANYMKPVWPFIEAPSPFDPTQWSGVTATPSMIVAEAWNAIIGGARGIEYFDTDFCGSTCGYPGGSETLASTNSGYSAMQAAVKSFDTEVATLAPIINDPFANGYVQSSVTNSNKMNVMAKYDQSSTKFYVFAAPRFNSTQTATYTVSGGYTGQVTVYGENRAVQATNGVFSDTVAGQTGVHIYVIP
jgi:hypothetical protein